MYPEYFRRSNWVHYAQWDELFSIAPQLRDKDEG
jgi:hypothetical protein